MWTECCAESGNVSFERANAAGQNASVFTNLKTRFIIELIKNNEHYA